MKCSEVTVNGVDIPVQKDPITDPGKRSKTGRLDLVYRDGQFKTVQGKQSDSLLWTVFENGKILYENTFEEIRARARSWGQR